MWVIKIYHMVGKKRSILFDLPYWEKNLVRHNLDVMHIEKNVCDKVLFTLMDSDKSKDNYKVRLDSHNWFHFFL